MPPERKKKRTRNRAFLSSKKQQPSSPKRNPNLPQLPPLGSSSTAASPILCAVTSSSSHGMTLHSRVPPTAFELFMQKGIEPYCQSLSSSSRAEDGKLRDVNTDLLPLLR